MMLRTPAVRWGNGVTGRTLRVGRAGTQKEVAHVASLTTAFAVIGLVAVVLWLNGRI